MRQRRSPQWWLGSRNKFYCCSCSVSGTRSLSISRYVYLDSSSNRRRRPLLSLERAARGKISFGAIVRSRPARCYLFDRGWWWWWWWRGLVVFRGFEGDSRTTNGPRNHRSFETRCVMSLIIGLERDEKFYFFQFLFFRKRYTEFWISIDPSFNQI